MFLVIPLKGEYLAFKKQKFHEEIKVGRVLGTREVFVGMNWEITMYSKQRGSCLTVRLSDVDYFGSLNVAAFNSFIEFLLNLEAKRLSDSKRNLQYLAQNSGPKSGSFGFLHQSSDKVIEDKTITEFIEVDVREKKVNLGTANSSSGRRDEICRDFKTDLAIPPLFVHKCFKLFFEDDSVHSNILDHNKVNSSAGDKKGPSFVFKGEVREPEG